MTNDLAPYVAVLLVNLAEQYEGGMSAPGSYLYQVPSTAFKLEIEPDDLDKAVKILVECGIASLSNDQLAGKFVAIKKGNFAKFVERAAADMERYDAIVAGSEDEHLGISRAESRSYPHWNLLNKYKPLRSYSEFGEPWAEQLLERLRSKEPLEALSAGLPVQSAAWTGIEKRMTPARLSEIQSKVRALTGAIEQSDLSERDKKNAHKRIQAVESLLDAPDPPWKVIVALLNAPVLTAFLNVTAILSLIFGN